MKRAAILIALVLCVGACGGDDDTAKPQTVEYKLASIDAGKSLEADDPSVHSYAKSLDALEAKCGNTRVQLGDLAVAASEKKNSAGVMPTVQIVLGSVVTMIGDDAKRDDCAPVFDQFLVSTGATG